VGHRAGDQYPEVQAHTADDQVHRQGELVIRSREPNCS
jgi:hypothetical protein